MQPSAKMQQHSFVLDLQAKS